MAILELDGCFFQDTDACCDFCGAHHEECADLVIGPSTAICSECLLECQKRIQAHRDGLPAPERAAMLALDQVMRTAAAALRLIPRCPWCKSTDVTCEEVDIGVGMQQATPYECSCGGTQFSPGVLKSNVTCQEWDYQWHAPEGWYNITVPVL